MSERETKRISVVIERWLAARVKALAAIDGRTLSETVEIILEEATEALVPFQEKARKEWKWRTDKNKQVDELERLYNRGKAK